MGELGPRLSIRPLVNVALEVSAGWGGPCYQGRAVTRTLPPCPVAVSPRTPLPGVPRPSTASGLGSWGLGVRSPHPALFGEIVVKVFIVK